MFYIPGWLRGLRRKSAAGGASRTRLDVLAAAHAGENYAADWTLLSEATRDYWRGHARPVLRAMDAVDPLRAPPAARRNPTYRPRSSPASCGDRCPFCAIPTAAVFGGPPHCPLPDCLAPADLYCDVSADVLAAERAADETFEHAPVVRAAANGRRTWQQMMDAWLNASRLEASTHAELCSALAAGDVAIQ